MTCTIGGVTLMVTLATIAGFASAILLGALLGYIDRTRRPRHD